MNVVAINTPDRTEPESPLLRSTIGGAGAQAPEVFNQAAILSNYSKAEQKIIRHHLAILSGFAKQASINPEMQVHIGPKGSGWYWNFKDNYIVAEVEDLLKRPLSQLKALILHEATHALISKLEHLSEEKLKVLGYLISFNALEDPRVNNCAMDQTPSSRAWFEELYKTDLAPKLKKAEEEIKLKVGNLPRHIEAGMLFIRHWFAEISGDASFAKDYGSPEVRAAVDRCLKDAKRLWWTYPEAGELREDKKAAKSYTDFVLSLYDRKIWPVLKELVDQDLKDRKSSGTKNPLKELIEAGLIFGEVLISKELPECKPGPIIVPLPAGAETVPDMPEFQARLREIAEINTSNFRKILAEHAAVANELEAVLKEIFHERKKSKLEAGKKAGPILNIPKRIVETARGIHPINTKAFEKKTKPLEHDYEIELLVDLSGSMQGEKAKATQAGVIVLSDVLEKLGISYKVVGFNCKLHRIKNEAEKLTPEVESRFETMISEVSSARAAYNDDGWALSESANALRGSDKSRKILIVISDGQPVPSSRHAGDEYELTKVIGEIVQAKDLQLIGIGLGPDTEHVKKYYPISRANVPVSDFARALKEVLIKEINYGK